MSTWRSVGSALHRPGSAAGRDPARASQEPRFAQGAAPLSNLFEHDLPRLSVDIDLAWLPVHDYAEDAKLIAALGQLADAMRARPLQLQVQASAGEGGAVTGWWPVAARACAIETTPVMRGTVHPVRSHGRAPEGRGGVRLRRSAGTGFRRPVCRKAGGGIVAAASA